MATVSLDEFTRLGAKEAGLVTVSTLRADDTIQASLVNAGVLDDPVAGSPAVGFVVAGNTRKLRLLRARPRATVVVRSGWEWAAVEGPVTIIGPDDPQPGIDAEGVRVLLRDVFKAAGGNHDDWDTYDQVMRDERRTAVLVQPERVYSNG